MPVETAQRWVMAFVDAATRSTDLRVVDSDIIFVSNGLQGVSTLTGICPVLRLYEFACMPHWNGLRIPKAGEARHAVMQQPTLAATRPLNTMNYIRSSSMAKLRI
jgi:hypothetical protein